MIVRKTGLPLKLICADLMLHYPGGVEPGISGAAQAAVVPLTQGLTRVDPPQRGTSTWRHAPSIEYPLAPGAGGGKTRARGRSARLSRSRAPVEAVASRATSPAATCPASPKPRGSPPPSPHLRRPRCWSRPGTRRRLRRPAALATGPGPQRHRLQRRPLAQAVVVGDTASTASPRSRGRARAGRPAAAESLPNRILKPVPGRHSRTRPRSGPTSPARSTEEPALRGGRPRSLRSSTTSPSAITTGTAWSGAAPHAAYPGRPRP